jgi:hypothetical protein
MHPVALIDDLLCLLLFKLKAVRRVYYFFQMFN